MNSPNSFQSKWIMFAAMMMIATLAASQITLQDYTSSFGYTAAQTKNDFVHFSASQAEYFGSLRYNYGGRKFRNDHQRGWDYVCGTGFGVGFIALAVVDPGNFALSILSGLAGSTTPPSNSNPVKPSYLNNSQYNFWNLIMIGGVALGSIGAVMDYSEHRYALNNKTRYMNNLCYTRQGYTRFHVAGCGNLIGLGISLY